MHGAQQCGCGGGSASLVPYGQYPAPVYSARPDQHDFPEPYILEQTPYYQSFWRGNQLPSTRWAGLYPFDIARADYYQQVQLSAGKPPLSQPMGAVQQFIRRMSAAWSASYGR